MPTVTAATAVSSAQRQLPQLEPSGLKKHPEQLHLRPPSRLSHLHVRDMQPSLFVFGNENYEIVLNRV